MNEYVCLFIGFIFGIIVSIIIKKICNCRSVSRNRNRGSLIVRRRRLQNVQIMPQQTDLQIYDTDSDSDVDSDVDTNSYSITIDDNLEETKGELEETKEILVRIAQNV